MARKYDVLDDFTGRVLPAGGGLSLVDATALARSWTETHRHVVLVVLDRTSAQYVQRWKGGERIPTKPRKWLNE